MYEALLIAYPFHSLRCRLELDSCQQRHFSQPRMLFAVESQAFDRVHRVGQMRNVLVQSVVITDTVEDRILCMQEQKLFILSYSAVDPHS